MIKIKDGFYYHGDCLEIMKTIGDSSIDMILCDLPYGTTACPWDTIIPFDKLWEQYKRIISPTGAIVLTATQPFTSLLVCSNIDMFKYSMVWKKTTVSGFTNAKNKPLNTTEDVLVFSKGTCANGSKNKMQYYPQGLTKINTVRKNSKRTGVDTIGARPSRQNDYVQEYTNYPRNLIEIASNSGEKIHPTQKPVTLYEYLIKTYTTEGQTVLDNCAGSGTLGIAATNVNRSWICIEQDQKFYDISVKRIQDHVASNTIPTDLFKFG